MPSALEVLANIIIGLDEPSDRMQIGHRVDGFRGLARPFVIERFVERDMNREPRTGMRNS